MNSYDRKKYEQIKKERMEEYKDLADDEAYVIVQSPFQRNKFPLSTASTVKEALDKAGIDYGENNVFIGGMPVFPFALNEAIKNFYVASKSDVLSSKDLMEIETTYAECYIMVKPDTRKGRI